VAVLNADDPMVQRMAPLCDGEVIYFGIQHSSQVLAEHLAQGGRAISVRAGYVMMLHGLEEQPLIALDKLRVEQDLEATLAAVGAAWALGIATHLIRTGIETFEAVQPFQH
jgi:cyanophycin synthetase